MHSCGTSDAAVQQMIPSSSMPTWRWLVDAVVVQHHAPLRHARVVERSEHHTHGRLDGSVVKHGPGV